jgi:hypothetical protein
MSNSEEKTVQPNKMKVNKCDFNTEFLSGATNVITRRGRQETQQRPCAYTGPRTNYAHVYMSLSHDTASRSGYVKPWRVGLGETPVAHGRQFHSYSNSRPALDLSSHEGRLLSFLSLVQVFTWRQFKSRISGHRFIYLDVGVC